MLYLTHRNSNEKLIITANEKKPAIIPSTKKEYNNPINKNGTFFLFCIFYFFSGEFTLD